MNVRVSNRRSIRWVVAAGSMVLFLGGTGVIPAGAGSPDTFHRSVGARLGEAAPREAPIVRVHGPWQVPRIGRIPRSF